MKKIQGFSVRCQPAITVQISTSNNFVNTGLIRKIQSV